MPSRRVGDGLGILVAVLVIASPELFTSNGFALDFTNHLWLVGVQERSIAAHLSPTYFTSTQADGVFYPFFMFYGGTLYVIGGALAALLAGQIVVSYVVLSLAAITAAYGGMLWLARQLGVRTWYAHAPALTFTTSAYYVTNIYGRGAWPEFIATSMIPLIYAAGWRLLTEERPRMRTATLFVIACLVFSGSHNITLVLGVVASGLTLGLLLLAQGTAILPAARRLLRALGLLLVAVAVNAWFLLPDISFAARTQVGMASETAGAPFLDAPGLLFDPGRHVPMASGTPGLFVQLPVEFLAWALLVALVLGRRARLRLQIAGVVLCIVMAMMLVAITSIPVWDALPKAIRDAQFPYRVNTYVVLLIAALVLVGALICEEAGLGRRVRVMRAGLLFATLFSVAICVWQLWVPNVDFKPSYRDVNRVFVSAHVVPRTWYSGTDYADASLNVLLSDPDRVLNLPATAMTSDRVTLRVDPPSGFAPIISNVTGGPYVVSLTGGLREVGRTLGGQMVLERRPEHRTGPVSVTLRPAGGRVSEGRIVTFAALAVLAALFIASLRRRVGAWQARHVRQRRGLNGASGP